MQAGRFKLPTQPQEKPKLFRVANSAEEARRAQAQREWQKNYMKDYRAGKRRRK